MLWGDETPGFQGELNAPLARGFKMRDNPTSECGKRMWRCAPIRRHDAET
jgi:hypothetical protein